MPFDPAPANLAVVTSPEWLTTMLRQRWPDAHVTRADITEKLATQATKVRLALEVTGGDTSMPRAICIKGILTNTGAVLSSTLVETAYYRDQAALLPVRTPPCIHAAFNADATHGLIVMHDLKAANSVFLSALQPFTPAETLKSLDQIATLHAAGWTGARPHDRTWPPRFLDQIGSRPIMPTAMLQDLLDGPRGMPLPPAIKDAERLQRAVATLSAQGHTEPAFLVHGDAHAGNIYRDTDGGVGLVDWQIFQQAEWALDVAYHIAAVLSPEDRRTHERALLDYYRARLAALGGPAIDPDQGWQRYRAGMVYGYFLWSITRKVEPAITEEFVRRLGTAVADLDSLPLLER